MLGLLLYLLNNGNDHRALRPWLLTFVAVSTLGKVMPTATVADPILMDDRLRLLHRRMTEIMADVVISLLRYLGEILLILAGGGLRLDLALAYFS